MIRYQIPPGALENRIDARDATWRRRAARRTARFQAAGAYGESSSIWSEIKDVYMQLQHNKCAYCERKFEGLPYGRIEHDIEHYRPKNAVEKWPPASAEEPEASFRFSMGDSWAAGYYLLAYSIFNYATACGVCNSVLKSNYFPIHGPRGTQSGDPRALRSERPLLIYPIGDVDPDDPEDLITFDGIIPIATRQSGYKSYRARATIAFFKLEKREHLREERAFDITLFWLAITRVDAAIGQERADLQAVVAHMTSERGRHSSCVRAFYRLYQQDRASATTLYLQALAFVRSKGLVP